MKLKCKLLENFITKLYLYLGDGFISLVSLTFSSVHVHTYILHQRLSLSLTHAYTPTITHTHGSQNFKLLTHTLFLFFIFLSFAQSFFSIFLCTLFCVYALYVIICRYPNLIDSGHEYDDGYETGVGDLMSHKYKLPTLPPPSSSPYSSLSSSSMSTISTSTMTPTNLVNPQQQQSPSYLSGGAANGNAGNTMNHYQQQQQQQPQQYHQNQQQYQPMQHQNHMNSFNSYHPMFGNRPMQHQPMSNVIKNEQSMTSSVDNDPYRFVDEDLSNGMNTTGLHGAMHQNYQHMTSPTIMSGNYTTSSNLHQQQQQNPTNGNASMMQFNEHHHMSPHHNHLGHPQQIQSQHGMMNGNANAQNIGHAGMNPNMMMMNDTPKKRGRKKKLRDENGYLSQTVLVGTK